MTTDPAAPVFIGGTGRSGTSILGTFLASHATLVTPVPENKLIVEEGGLRSLIDNLSRGDDFKSNHYAIARFIDWARVLRRAGFRNPALRAFHAALDAVASRFIGKRLSPARTARLAPSLRFSLYGIGEAYGLAHYDASLQRFLDQIIGETDAHGIIDTEGLIRPLYAPASADRQVLMAHARAFLAQLNAPSLQEAGAARWCDDTPLNALHAEFLLELYPDARIIHIVRDPRDVAASYLGKSWASRDLGLTLNRLQRHYRELAQVEARLPARSFRTFRLEDFVHESAGQVRSLCDFLGLEPERFDGSVSFSGASFGRFREAFSGEARALVEDRLGDAMARYGYS